MAPVSRYRNPRRCARAAATVLLPDPAGPSIVTISGAITAYPVDSCPSTEKKPGKLSASTASARWSSTPSTEDNPATAPSMASRWSPRLSNVPPRSLAGTPRTRNPSRVALMPAYPAKPVDHALDAVGLLQPRLRGAPHDGLARAAAGDEGEEVEPVDRRTGRGDGRADEFDARTSTSPAGSLVHLAAVVHGDPRTHALEHVEQPRPARVQPDPVDRRMLDLGTVRAPTRSGAAEERSLRDPDRVEDEPIGLPDADARRAPSDHYTRAFEKALGVVPRREPLDDGRLAVGESPARRTADLTCADGTGSS